MPVIAAALVLAFTVTTVAPWYPRSEELGRASPEDSDHSSDDGRESEPGTDAPSKSEEDDAKHAVGWPAMPTEPLASRRVHAHEQARMNRELYLDRLERPPRA